MNARQKAKKYKIVAELYKEKAKAFDRMVLAERFRKSTRRIGTIETIKIVKFIDDRIPEELIKNEVANDFGKFLLDNNLITWEYDAEYNNQMVRRLVASVKVAKG